MSSFSFWTITKPKKLIHWAGQPIATQFPDCRKFSNAATPNTHINKTSRAKTPHPSSSDPRNPRPRELQIAVVVVVIQIRSEKKGMRDLGRGMRCKVSGVCDAMRGRRGGFLEVRQAGWSWGREQSEEKRR
jgi:hypothetical protein